MHSKEITASPGDLCRRVATPQLRRAVFGLTLAALSLTPARGQEDFTLDALRDQATKLVQPYVPTNLDLAALLEVDPQALGEFWRQAQSALQAQSFEDLAWLQPSAEQVLALLRRSGLDEGQALADWLAPRLDYFDMANRVLRMRPSGPLPTPRSAPRGRLFPGPRPALAPAPAAVERQRHALAQDRSLWKNKLAERPAPASAGPLIPTLKSVFAAEGMPAQWVWLAEVESSLNPRARSPVGAAGLFQLMPATAERFGLSMRPTDERLAPEKNARAAARYLKLLYGQFRSWPLMLAAYNAGEGRVGRLLKQAARPTFEEIAGDLPLETQMYVPKVLATVSRREGVEAEQLPAPRLYTLELPPLHVVARVF